MYRLRAGFTLVEVMVVIIIIGLLVSVLYASYNEAREQSRDAERKTDLRNLQSAIELYKNKYGRYPERCPTANGSWSGQPGTDYRCQSGANEYILGIAPEFIPRLPQDRFLNGNDSGYVYTVNSDGTVYKLMAFGTVETEVVGYGHPLFHCDYNGQADDNQLCITAAFTNNNTPSWCIDTSQEARTSYGVWGGFATPTNVNLKPGTTNYDRSVEQLTESIICDIP